VVREATREYAHEMDGFGQFLDERCELVAARTVRAGVLYSTYKNWCGNQGLHWLSNLRVWRKLDERGITKANSMHGVTYRGIGLRESDPIHELQDDVGGQAQRRDRPWRT